MLLKYGVAAGLRCRNEARQGSIACRQFLASQVHGAVRQMAGGGSGRPTRRGAVAAAAEPGPTGIQLDDVGDTEADVEFEWGECT